MIREGPNLVWRWQGQDRGREGVKPYQFTIFCLSKLEGLFILGQIMFQLLDL